MQNSLYVLQFIHKGMLVGNQVSYYNNSILVTLCISLQTCLHAVGPGCSCRPIRRPTLHFTVTIDLPTVVAPPPNYMINLHSGPKNIH